MNMFANLIFDSNTKDLFLDNLINNIRFGKFNPVIATRLTDRDAERLMIYNKFINPVYYQNLGYAWREDIDGLEPLTFIERVLSYKARLRGREYSYGAVLRNIKENPRIKIELENVIETDNIVDYYFSNLYREIPDLIEDNFVLRGQDYLVNIFIVNPDVVEREIKKTIYITDQLLGDNEINSISSVDEFNLVRPYLRDKLKGVISDNVKYYVDGSNIVKLLRNFLYAV